MEILTMKRRPHPLPRGFRKREALLHPLTAYPLLRLLLPYMLGIVLGEGIYPALASYPWPLWGSGILLLLSTVGLISRQGRLAAPERPKGGGVFSATQLSVLTTITTSTLCLLAGALLVTAQRRATDIHWPAAPQTYRVMVTQMPREAPHSRTFIGKVLRGAQRGALVQWRVSGDTLATIAPGDILWMRANIQRLTATGNPGDFDYAAWLRRQGVSGTAFCPSTYWKKVEHPSERPPLAIRLLRLRQQFERPYHDYFRGSHLAIISALTLGDKTGIDTATRQLYAAGGISHILALSGLHLSILYALLMFFVERCSRRYHLHDMATLLALIAIWGFVLLTGHPSSLLRAAIMFTLLQLIQYFHHDAAPVNHLIIALSLLLLVSPTSLFDIGLQFSVLSVTGILLLSPRMALQKPMAVHPLLRNLYQLGVTSIAAQLATLPLVAYYFHTIPIYSLLINLIVVPLVGPLLCLSLLFLAVPCLRSLSAVLLNHLLAFIEHLCQFFTHLPGATWQVFPSLPLTLLLLFFLLHTLFFWPKRPSQRRRTLYLGLGILLLATGYEGYRRRPDALSPEIVVCHVYGRPQIHFIHSRRHSYLWLPEEPRTDSVAATLRVRALWASRAMTPPEVFSDHLLRRDLLSQHHVTTFSGCRIAVLGSQCLSTPPRRPLPVDYLLVANDCRIPPSVALQYFRPHHLILSGALREWVRQAFQDAATQQHLPVYNMQESGALHISLTASHCQP